MFIQTLARLFASISQGDHQLKLHHYPMEGHGTVQASQCPGSISSQRSDREMDAHDRNVFGRIYLELGICN
jgi:hypothetical protein